AKKKADVMINKIPLFFLLIQLLIYSVFVFIMLYRLYIIWIISEIARKKKDREIIRKIKKKRDT
ncbi:MAG: hypothetical protein MR867_02525, partial [Eubacterium sp.]|nr:hypothetical protein [Eubacterium sp.]